MRGSPACSIPRTSRGLLRHVVALVWTKLRNPMLCLAGSLALPAERLWQQALVTITRTQAYAPPNQVSTAEQKIRRLELGFRLRRHAGRLSQRLLAGELTS